MPAQLVFNGIHARTGTYALPPMSAADLAAIAAQSVKTGELSNKQVLKSLQQRKTLDQQAIGKGHLGVIEGIEPKDLAQAGWAVVFAHDADPAIVDSLGPLLDRRKEQAQKIKEGRYRKCVGDDGYCPGDTKYTFLDNHGAGGGGAADPDQFPYYVLIVGSPDVIPWSFQYQLDVQYAVGRIYFDDLDDYARYAQSVVQAESGGVELARRATFFGTSHKDDLATTLSATDLIAPLSKLMADDQPKWSINTIAPADASQACLTELLGGSQTPAVLFTATHGMMFDDGDPRQLAEMGSLLTNEWPGPSYSGPVPDSFYFNGDHISSDARLAGLISFHFACFGAGTPQTSDFKLDGQTTYPTLAKQAFVARLPQRLLAHPNGGALAVIGHVERAWGYSFKAENGDTQLRSFKSVLKRLMEGHPIGSAMEPFNQRYAELSSDLSSSIFTNPDPDQMAFMWTSNNDARNYVVMGDPAVRLHLTDDPSKQKRETMTPIEVTSKPQPVKPQPAKPGAVQYGMMSDISATVQDVTSKIMTRLAQAVDSLATVEVSTYTTSDMATAKANQMQGATLRAYSRVRLDGNAEICVPETNGQVDDVLWKIHSDMVQKALDNRTATLKAIASAVASLRIP